MYYIILKYFKKINSKNKHRNLYISYTNYGYSNKKNGFV